MTESLLSVGFSEPSTASGRLSVLLAARDQQRTVFFGSSDTALTATGEAGVTCALLVAMTSAQECTVDAPLSPRFLSGVRRAQEILSFWRPELATVDVRSTSTRVQPRLGGDRVGMFFSGGLDSFYTLLKHEGEITDLIFVHGFDIRLHNHELRRRASEMVRDVAARLGKEVIEIETDLEPLLSSCLKWDYSHGIALACVGHLLQHHFRRIYIPATHTYGDLLPWGSHPLLDPLWSTETLEFVHDGCEATRIRKAARIAESDVALDSLRVCFRNWDGAYNCGRCEKCVRTKINLQCVGALGRCRTLGALDLRDVYRIANFGESTRAFIEENLRALERQRNNPELERALRRVLRPGPIVRARRAVAAKGAAAASGLRRTAVARRFLRPVVRLVRERLR